MSHHSDSPQVVAEVAAGGGIPIIDATQRFRGYRRIRKDTDGNDVRVDTATHVNTVMRWILDGIRLPDGSRLHLEACRLGGRWLTSEAAIARFIAAQTPTTSTAPTPPVHTQRQRQRSATKASERLDRIGI